MGTGLPSSSRTRGRVRGRRLRGRDHARALLAGRLAAGLGGIALRMANLAVQFLPAAGSDAVGRAIGRLVLLTAPKRRRLARANIALAFPEKSAAEVDWILRGCCQNLGRSLVEFLRLPRLCKASGLAQIVKLEGAEHLAAALAKGRGVVLLTAHFGNWEMIGARLVAEGFPLTVLARETRDSSTTRLMTSIREAVGMRVLHTQQGHQQSNILRSLRRNEVVGFLIDQNAGHKGIFIDFLGRPASTHAGAALFALRSKAPVIPLFCFRDEYCHSGRLLPEVELIRTGSLRGDVAANTAAFTRLVEAQVRARPELWFWLHDRWRTRPPGERARNAE